MLHVQHVRQLADDLQTGIEGALFKLTEVAPAHLRFVCKIILRKPFRVAKAAQIEGKHFPQVHAKSEPTCSQYAPRYTPGRAQANCLSTEYGQMADWTDGGNIHLKWYDPIASIFVGLVIAIGGFLLIDDYFVRGSVVANAMTGEVLGVLPYRYVLLISLLLFAFGLYRWLTIKQK